MYEFECKEADSYRFGGRDIMRVVERDNCGGVAALLRGGAIGFFAQLTQWQIPRAILSRDIRIWQHIRGSKSRLDSKSASGALSLTSVPS